MYLVAPRALLPVGAQAGGVQATQREREPHYTAARVALLLEEVANFQLQEVALVALAVLLRVLLGLQLRQLCLQGADRRLEVLRGHERRRPGPPRWLPACRLETGEHLLRRVRGGKERLGGPGSVVVAAKQWSRVQHRGVILARGRGRTESSRVRGVRGVAGAAGRVIAHHAREGGDISRGNLFLGPLLARRAGPRAPRPDFADRLGANAELWRDGLAVHHRAAPELSRILPLRAQHADFERARGSELSLVLALAF